MALSKSDTETCVRVAHSSLYLCIENCDVGTETVIISSHGENPLNIYRNANNNKSPASESGRVVMMGYPVNSRPVTEQTE